MDTRHRYQRETTGSTDQRNLFLEKREKETIHHNHNTPPLKIRKVLYTGGERLVTADLETPSLIRFEKGVLVGALCHFDRYSCYSPMNRTSLGTWACLSVSLSRCHFVSVPLNCLCVDAITHPSTTPWLLFPLSPRASIPCLVCLYLDTLALTPHLHSQPTSLFFFNKEKERSKS